MRTPLLCIMVCAFNNSYSQVLENVKTSFSGEKVIITYDLLSDDPAQRFKITAFSAHDNYASPLQHVSGAVGDNVAAGRGLRIEWDARSSLPSNFNGTISVRLKGVAVPRLKPLDQSVYKKGGNVNLTWTGGGKADKMNIELVREDKVYEILGSSVENTNAFTWKIPNSVKAGQGYTIRLTNATDPMPPSSTGNFEIRAKIPLLVKIAVPVVVIGGAFLVKSLMDDEDDGLPAITVKP